ncbi:MAG: hypothetical protein N2444_08970 [Methylocystis sp.]|nr:hypothetical protein [Methylocystis sp.]
MDEEIASVLKEAMDKAEDPTVFPKEKFPSMAGSSSASAKMSDAPDHNEIFGKLVTGDDDIVGLVAYSLYKQNKIDWMRAFESRFSRLPNDQEFAAYIVGENTPRRVSTYRFLAEATVNRTGSGAMKTIGAKGARPFLTATMNIFYGLIGVGLIAALIVLLRFVFSLRHGGA